MPGSSQQVGAVVEAQAQVITHLKEVTCKCCPSDKKKGKGKQRAVMPDSPVLGSPIVLVQSSNHKESSDSSYITPPITTCSPSVILTQSVTPLQLADKEQDIPMHLQVSAGLPLTRCWRR